DIKLDGLLAVNIVDENIGDWVVDSRFRVCLDIHLALKLGLIELEKIIGYLTLIKSIKGNILAVWRPPHRGSLIELFAIHPACDPVLGASFFITVASNRDLVCSARLTEPHVSIALIRFELSIRGSGRGILTAAFGAAGAPAPTHSSGFCVSRRRADFSGCAGCDVIVIGFSVSVVIEWFTACLPLDSRGSQFHRSRMLLCHLMRWIVGGHRFEPILGARRERQNRERHSKGDHDSGVFCKCDSVFHLSPISSCDFVSGFSGRLVASLRAFAGLCAFARTKLSNSNLSQRRKTPQRLTNPDQDSLVFSFCVICATCG